MSGHPSPIVTRERDQRFNAVFHAIAEADEAPTRRDIVLETGFSDSKTTRVLRDLRDRGRVRAVQDDDDGRIVRYEISPGIDQ